MISSSGIGKYSLLFKMIVEAAKDMDENYDNSDDDDDDGDDDDDDDDDMM